MTVSQNYLQPCSGCEDVLYCWRLDVEVPHYSDGVDVLVCPLLFDEFEQAVLEFSFLVRLSGGVHGDGEDSVALGAVQEHPQVAVAVSHAISFCWVESVTVVGQAHPWVRSGEVGDEVGIGLQVPQCGLATELGDSNQAGIRLVHRGQEVSVQKPAPYAFSPIAPIEI
eukprot:CAMPEP_0114631736 /NCGR_PEP_ID=MMETSP0168-20121206/14569_1 /TAXON_ID=95228 ORGANISM="Vannella sp., Strain DIVA3 517/6/12" /NCGR_SAMPLE_ID=MMETSP0168 /ASSEMBLY_ACC=CAM_ASM_000044 /LENGTH=167 /DNA_ID=CAMNT_0001843317 /DNA_START=153 /DNA_END=656 /DNA_ORIENTATION=+